jgi:hypothetical protein
MAFFKDLGKKITEGVQDASEKASELVEVNKLNFAISKEKGAIEDAKKQIGTKIFATYQAGGSVPEMLSADMADIDSHLQAVAGLEAKIRALKGVPEEPVVSEVQMQIASAPASAADVAVSPGRFCSNCGARMVEGAAFCGECGQKS